MTDQRVRADLYCSHGKPFYGDTRITQCIECEITWRRAALDSANERVVHHRRMLEIAEKLRDTMLTD